MTLPPFSRDASNVAVAGASLAARTSLRSVELRLGKPMWNVNRTSEPGLGANECVLHLGDVVRVHGIPPSGV